MFKFFKRKEESEEGVNKPWVKGMVYGLGGAIVLAVIIFGVVFGVRMFQGKPAGGQPGTAKANLRITVITQKDCVDCFDINQLIDALKTDANIKQETLNLGDNNAKKLIDKYKITKVPTIIVSGDLDKNANLQAYWKALGDITDGVFVFRQVIPPYVDVATGQLKGVLSLIELTDTSCKECYDVKLHETALKNLGIAPKVVTTVDVSSAEGKQLVTKYKIEKAPTILIGGEVSEYANLVQMWPTYGKIDADGTYIFTDLSVMGTYKDLVKNKVVVVAPPAAPPATATPAQ